MNKERNIIILICALIAGVLGYKFSDIDGGTVHDMSAEEKRLSAALAKDSKYITPQKKKFKDLKLLIVTVVIVHYYII